MKDAIIKVIPIVLLLIFGKIIKQKGLLKDETEVQLKSGVIYITLPMILFLTFKNMELRPEYFLLSLLMFFLMILFYIVGIGVNKFLKINSIVFPFFVTAFAFGLLGIPLFEGVYGIENLGELSILGISNEFFVWFIYLTMVKQKLNGEKFEWKSLLGFIKSPIVIAIFAGLLFNILNVDLYIGEFALYQGLLKTFDYFSVMTTPIILIVVGAGMNLELKYVKKAFYFVILRLIIILGIGYAVKFLVIDRFFVVGHMFDLAYFTYLILPTPFVYAIFVGQYSDEENKNIVNNATVIGTIICVALFVVMVLVTQ